MTRQADETNADACRRAIFAEETGALFRDSDRGLLLGCGPFEAAAEPPIDQTAFYVNDYELSDPKPWKIPSRLEVLPVPEEQPPFPPILWEQPDEGAFLAVIDEIMSSLRAGAIEKTVPALGETGRLASGDPREFACRAAGAPAPLQPYAFWEAGRGFAGFSPEYLFQLRGRTLTTMALAGTAPSADASRLLGDAKEIAEHQIVADAIARRLSPHGNLGMGARRIRSLGPVSHLFTPIRLEAREELPPDFWIRLLHPTPALGPQPRTAPTLAQLKEWRARLNCPPVFGAPFGIARGGSVDIAAVLRGVTWKGDTVTLTAGGGVVAASSAEGEWREFGLKRASVKALFGLVR